MNRHHLTLSALAAAPAFALLAPAFLPTSAAGQPFNAYACQLGPGVPIATGHLFTLDTNTGAMTNLGLPVCNGAPLMYDPPTARLLAWGGIGQTNGPAIGGLYDLTTLPGVLLGTAVPLGTGPGLARDPTTGRYYLLISTDNDTAFYEVTLSPLSCRFINYQWGLAASSLAINSQGRAFATDDSGAKLLYSVNTSTGVLTPVGPLNLTGTSGDNPQALCFDGADTLWMITAGTIGNPALLYTVNTSTGQTTSIRPLGISGWYTGLAILP